MNATVEPEQTKCQCTCEHRPACTLCADGYCLTEKAK